MPDPKNTKTSDTIYSWNGRQVNKRFSDSISFQRNYANKMYEAGKKDFDFDKIKRGMNLMPGPGTLKKKFQGGEQTTTYNMSPYKMKSPYGMMAGQQDKKSIKDAYGNKQGSTAAKLAKGIRDFHIGAAGFIGPGGIGKGLKSLAGAISKIKNPTTAKFAGKLLNFSKKLKPKEHVGPKFGSYSSKRGQRRPDGSRY
jgi:hypothetical protein|tara:strand:+ start:17 stop:607 length:591 start_codon:yes stop_codon:yes gene_type:complete